MSSYLFMKKGETEFCCFQSCFPVYGYLGRFSSGYEKWEELTEEEVRCAIEACKDDINSKKDEIRVQNEIISKLKKKDEIEEAIYDRENLFKELEELNIVLNYLFFIQDICEHSVYDPETNTDKKLPVYMMKD